MRELLHGRWIGASLEPMEEAPAFLKTFRCPPVRRATLFITALGVYEALLNGHRVGDFILAPGWTCYEKRLQVQAYDVTPLIQGENCLQVGLGKGWYGSRLGWQGQQPGGRPGALLATLRLEQEDGQIQDVVTDESWTWCPSPVRASELYDGETIDNRVDMTQRLPVVLRALPKDNLIAQEGEPVKEQMEIAPVGTWLTPKGERVVDFGQNLTGYVSLRVRGPQGHTLRVYHGETLDKAGNFYTENLRTAKAALTCILKEGENRFKPRYTFYGFRYIRLENWPGEVNLEDFRAVVLHSDMKRTGHFSCGHPLVNRLYENILWGQRGNFVDVPTDCPQRDERLGWTGDAQVFIPTAAYNYQVDRFFAKWLRDLKADQRPDGAVPGVVPDVTKNSPPEQQALISAAWGDAACVCPWQLYLSYGDQTVLAEQFESMKAWVEYMRRRGSQECLWDGDGHYGDWLGLDALEEEGGPQYKGATDEDLIACACFAHCTDLLVRAGKVLGKDVAQYEGLHRRIVEAFRQTYMPGGRFPRPTQTSYVLALQMGLCQDPRAAAQALADQIRADGGHLTTGFVGTPHLLFALSDNGQASLAYDLLLREAYPSWLFSVNQGATTVWEHWDGMREDGTMWPVEMNSFNHYAYGSVGAWLYGAAAGIRPVEEGPGYRTVRICPLPDKRLGYVQARLVTPQGEISSAWRYHGDQVRYTVTIPQGVTAILEIGGQTWKVCGGTYQF